MTQYQYRPRPVDAKYFDGTPSGANEVIAWLHQLVPELTVRQRIEYNGWADPTGHVELEIRDHDDQIATNDWIILDRRTDPPLIRVLTAREFHDTFEPQPE